MNIQIRKRTIIIIYSILVIAVLLFSFLAQDSNMTPVVDDQIDMDSWYMEGKEIELPYADKSEFEVSTILPEITDRDILVAKVRYDSVRVFVDGEEIFTTKNSYAFGHATNAGNKEINIPLKDQYSNKEIKLKVNLHRSIYGSTFSKAFITTKAGYALKLISDSWMIIILIVLFITSGLIECFVAATLILNGIKVRRQFTFESLFFAGLFSIVSAVWTFCNTRIPAVYTGQMVTYSIIGYVNFMLMPLTFIFMLASMEEKKNKIINAFKVVFSIAVIIAILLNVLNLMEWAHTTLLCHIMDGVDISIAVIMGIDTIRRAETRREKRIMFAGNTCFVVVCAFAIVKYIAYRESFFMPMFLLALMVYIVTQVFVVINRIGLTAQEEADFEEVQLYAYTDDLTKLGNRRYFYEILRQYEKGEIPENLTVVYMDVNRLKYYNDNFGHVAGDELLNGAAECIKKAFPDGTVCRMGGDEFAVIVVANYVSVEKMISNLRNNISKWHGKNVDELSIAIGCASHREYPNVSLVEIGRIADDRMFGDKKKYYDETGYERRGVN